MSPPSCPRTCPVCPGAPFPRRGPAGQFPRFLGTTKHSDFLPPIPPHFVSFARWYRRCALGFDPASARRSTRGPGVVHRIPRTGSARETTGAPRFLDGPHYERAVLSDPGGTSALGHYHASMLPSAKLTASTPARTVISGLDHTARPIAVYASQGGLPHRHARLAFGWLASLSGRG